MSVHIHPDVDKSEIGAKRINDVVVNALELYDVVFQEVEEGNTVTLLTQTEAGETTAYDLFAP